ncbi:MAG: COG3650 family protein [Vicinamibacterales bacterium]
MSAQTIALPIRALGTEPFWALDIDSASLRFTTPDDQRGIHFPPIAPSVAGDTVAWVGETERAAFDVRIWREQCSDGMSDRVYPYSARVRVDGTTYKGCADTRPAGSSTLYPIGTWVVADHRIPGVAAMTDVEAARWHGRILSFRESEVISQADTCRRPVFRNRNAPTDSVLREFRVAPAALGLEGRATLGVTEVICAGTRWPAAGGLLLWVDSSRVYTVWDGVFFGLRRSRGGSVP